MSKTDAGDFGVTIIAGLIAMVIAAAIIFPASLYWAWAASIIWGWFAVPIFGLPSLGVWQIAGLLCMLGLMRPPRGKDERSITEILSMVILSPPLALGFAWVCKYMGGL